MVKHKYTTVGYYATALEAAQAYNAAARGYFGEGAKLLDLTTAASLEY